MSDVIAGRTVEDSEQTSYTYDELMGLTFKLVPESSKYAQQQDGTWADMSDDADYMRGVESTPELPGYNLYANGVSIICLDRSRTPR